MKQHILLLVTTTLLFACINKNPSQLAAILKYSSGKGTAILNGKPFASTAAIVERSLSDADKINISMYVYLNEEERQVLNISNIAAVQGMQSISATSFAEIEAGNNESKNECCSVVFKSLHKGALDNDYYVLDSAPGNYLYVDSYNAAKAEMKGHFNLTLCRRKDAVTAQLVGLPDTLRITNGKFDVVVKWP